jgi:hypothetical protein
MRRRLFLAGSIGWLFNGCSVRVTNASTGETKKYHILSEDPQKRFMRRKGASELHLAVYHNDKKEVERLLSAGYDPLQKAVDDSGKPTITPLLIAFTMKNDGMLARLTEAAAKSRQGRSLSEKESFDIFAPLWARNKYDTFGIAAQYGYDELARKMFREIMKEAKDEKERWKIINILIDDKYERASKLVDKICHGCVEKSFDYAVDRVVGGSTFRPVKAYNMLVSIEKRYGPFISGSRWKRFQKIKKEIRQKAEERNKEWKDMWKVRPSGTLKLVPTKKTNKYDIYDGSDWLGTVTYKRKSSYYDIALTLFKPSRYMLGIYSPNLQELKAGDCSSGSIYADSLEDAILKMAQCGLSR